MMNKKTAILLGSTGLVGSALLNQLLSNANYEKVVVLGRRSCAINHPKIQEHIINFDQVQEWESLIHGHDLFIAFGTTLKKAGSQENQYKIDVDYPLLVAEAAAKNKVEACYLVSSMGANSKSKVFYSRMKGELDDKVKALDFKRVVIFKPSVLAGKRNEFRLAEQIAIYIFNILWIIPFIRAYRPIKNTIVARAMINAANIKKPANEYILGEIFKLAK